MDDLAGGGGGEQPAVRGVVPSRDDVAADVRRIVGGCRSRGDFQRLATPALDRLLALRQLRHDDGPDLLAEAIAAVDREPYRRFLEILLPLPFEEGERWSSLGPSRRGPGRGDLAAAVFELDTWDGCTRPSVALEDRSRRDWAELHLASALIQVATGDRSAAEGAPAESRWRPRASVLVAAAIGLLVIAAIAVFALGGDDGRAASGNTAQGSSTTSTSVRDDVLGRVCVAVGALDAGVAAEPAAADLAATLRSLHAEAGGESGVGCALAPAMRKEHLVVQELDSGEADLPGAIVLSGPTRGVVLSPAQWGSYQRVGSGDGSVVQSFGGAPEQVTRRTDGVVEVELEHHVLLVGETASSPHFWIYPQYVAWWRAHPELGLPTSNPTLDLSQDFQHGRATVPALGAEPVEQLVADPATDLPPLAERREHILHQDDSTSWWVDARDRRHWIATGQVWDCLGGQAVAIEHVPGYAIAALDRGGHATCPSDS